MSPADLAVLGTDYSTDIEQSADPAVYVIQACERAKVWLAQVLEHGDLDRIGELKSQAEAIRVYTMSKQLGKDAQLAAAEIVRRAERGIGLAVRRGQQKGTVRAHGRPEKDTDETLFPAKVSDFFARPQERADTYAMTDGVTDAQFDAAITEARGEGNLSRANVIRKVHPERSTEPKSAPPEPAEPANDPRDDPDWIPAPTERSPRASARRREIIREMAARGATSTQISDRIGTIASTVRQIARDEGIGIHADDALGAGTRKTIDSNRVVRETVAGVEGFLAGLRLVRFNELDPAEAKDWTVSLTESIRVLNRLKTKLKERSSEC